MRIKVAAVIAGLTVLGACTNQPTLTHVEATRPLTSVPAGTSKPSVAPIAPAAPVQTSTPNELPPGIGREAVLKGCGGCHGIGQILSERRSRMEWSDTVVNMITQGAPVSEAEFDQVVTYLATHFGAR
jgi:quinoprotein glucose dehydrogenase